MFGGKTAEFLATNPDVQLRLMLRDVTKCKLSGPNIEVCPADLDKPETMDKWFEGVDSVFLVTPMHPNLNKRETAIVDLCLKHGVKIIVKLGGAVKHDDALGKMHDGVMDKIRRADIQWAMVSPNSVMETVLLPYKDTIRQARALFSCAGDGKVGMVALKNIAEIAAMVLATDGHHEKNYITTGPASYTMTEVASAFTNVLGKKIDYVDMSEEDFARMLMKYDKTLTRERVDLEIICHFHAWKIGGADVVTDTYKKMTGKDPMSIEDFIKENSGFFSKVIYPGFLARMVRKSMLK